MNVAEIHAGPTAPSGRPRRHPFLGGLLVKDRLINEAQLERALASRSRPSRARSSGSCSSTRSS